MIAGAGVNLDAVSVHDAAEDSVRIRKLDSQRPSTIQADWRNYARSTLKLNCLNAA